MTRAYKQNYNIKRGQPDKYLEGENEGRFCCFGLCPRRGNRIKIKKMIRVKNYGVEQFFCSEKCREGLLGY